MLALRRHFILSVKAVIPLVAFNTTSTNEQFALHAGISVVIAWPIARCDERSHYRSTHDNISI